MKCTPMRPPVKMSTVDARRAASVGTTKPGRCATRNFICLVTAAAACATAKLSAESDLYPTNTASKALFS